MYNIVRKIEFCSGHRVLGHENKCSNLHGHNFTLFVHVQSKNLDNLGRVIDFSVIKKKVKDWIDANLDHNTIVYKNDLNLINCLKPLNQEKKIYILDKNPTAENIAYHLLHDIFPKILYKSGFCVHKIILYETDNCYVEIEL